jgi:phosphoserine phosphatase RsbU/P
VSQSEPLDAASGDDASGSDESDEIAERLANLQSLTDSALTQLDVDDMLTELLGRVREIFDVDTVAVLTLEKHSSDLEARAACGIEEEVHQGVRVPLGTGFAGRIAATRKPLRLNRVDATTVSNPILWEKGIRVMLGVPLLGGGDVLGVLHVGRLDDRPFGENDVVLLQVVADRIAGAIQNRQLAIERAATWMLERSLLPSRLPRCEGLEFATRYAAAEQHLVGGDWYDVFTVPSGELWIVMGDVAGHGLRAAVVMGRIRSALRAYALTESAPERVLELVDRKVNHFEIGTMATVACAVLEPPFDQMTVALAGHPPPAIVSPDEPARFVDVAPSPPIGTNLEVRRGSKRYDLDDGALVAFYTDGLVERRGESLDIGLERLRAAISPGQSDRVAADIMRRVIGGSVPGDDVALFVLHRTAPSD